MTLATKIRARSAAVVVGVLALVSCGSDDSTESTDTAQATTTADSSDDEVTTTDSETATDDGAVPDDSVTTDGLDTTAFFDGALTAEPVTADCTLADGTETECYELTVAGFPATRDSIGPWCPATTSDGAAGIWFDGEAVYDIDGQFILDLAEIYGDDTWQLYDEDGNVLSTDTSEEFNDLVTGGAQPDPDAGPVNECVYGEIEWADGGGPIAATVQIPVVPVLADSSTEAGGVLGVTLDGVRIEGSAPIDLILGNYTIGAFDPCGGHVNPQEGYHMHATTGCSDSTKDVPAGETAMFGYALDGFAIHAPYDPDVEADAGLDECNGHETEELGYHYHANQVEENAVLTCFSGMTTEAADGGGAGGGGGGGDGAGRPDEPPPGGDRTPPADG